MFILDCNFVYLQNGHHIAIRQPSWKSRAINIPNNIVSPFEGGSLPPIDFINACNTILQALAKPNSCKQLSWNIILYTFKMATTLYLDVIWEERNRQEGTGHALILSDKD